MSAPPNHEKLKHDSGGGCKRVLEAGEVEPCYKIGLRCEAKFGCYYTQRRECLLQGLSGAKKNHLRDEVRGNMDHSSGLISVDIPTPESSFTLSDCPYSVNHVGC